MSTEKKSYTLSTEPSCILSGPYERATITNPTKGRYTASDVRAGNAKIGQPKEGAPAYVRCASLKGGLAKLGPGESVTVSGGDVFGHTNVAQLGVRVVVTR